MAKSMDYFKIQKDILKLAEEFGQIYETEFSTDHPEKMALAQNANNVSNILWDAYYALDFFTSN